jgi:hypothetical protein
MYHLGSIEFLVSKKKIVFIFPYGSMLKLLSYDGSHLGFPIDDKKMAAWVNYAF